MFTVPFTNYASQIILEIHCLFWGCSDSFEDSVSFPEILNIVRRKIVVTVQVIQAIFSGFSVAFGESRTL